MKTLAITQDVEAHMPQLQGAIERLSSTVKEAESRINAIQDILGINPSPSIGAEGKGSPTSASIISIRTERLNQLCVHVEAMLTDLQRIYEAVQEI